MATCSVIFCAGVILETMNTHSLTAFYIGRMICGLGVGGSATIIPIYMSEMAPKDIRGQLGSCYQLTYTIGILFSYWIDYAVRGVEGTRQWQVPIALQLVPGVLMGVGMWGVCESVRWLLGAEREEEAWRSLVWIRGGESEEVRAEFEDMKRGLEEERHATAGFRVRELWEGPNLHRLLLAGGLFLAQQSTGSTALAYFGPQFFALLVGDGDRTLLLTVVFGAVKVVACFIFVVFLSDRFGRRPLLAGGAAFMAVCMIATAGVIKTYPQPGDGTVTFSGIATVALIYLDIIAYNFSWGPLPWPCASEIFPTRIREPGVAFGVGSQWLFNFVWSFSTPYIQAGLGWGTFLLFGLLDIVFVGFTYFFLKETAGKTLEEINDMFDGIDPDSEHCKVTGLDDDEPQPAHYQAQTCA
jgi:sugar porter (SP) family MFS transporter